MTYKELLALLAKRNQEGGFRGNLYGGLHSFFSGQGYGGSRPTSSINPGGNVRQGQPFQQPEDDRQWVGIGQVVNIGGQSYSVHVEAGNPSNKRYVPIGGGEPIYPGSLSDYSKPGGYDLPKKTRPLSETARPPVQDPVYPIQDKVAPMPDYTKAFKNPGGPVTQPRDLSPYSGLSQDYASQLNRLQEQRAQQVPQKRAEVKRSQYTL